MMRFRQMLVFSCLATVYAASATSAQERRAPAPEFSKADTRGIFFESLEDAFRGPRPTIASVRKSSMDALNANVGSTANKEDSASGDGGWAKLISTTAIEDEVKRLKLHFDSVVTTPGAFKSGGYQDARLDLSVLAMLFAIINDYTGEVRWKEQAAAARDLISRTAFNCKAGSTQVYNEAKIRKADLQDLVSGSGISSRDANEENDWSMIVDRSPLMEYAEYLSEAIGDASRNAKETETNKDTVKRNAQLLAVVGKVLTMEGLDEADDEDYAALSLTMTEASTVVAQAIDRGNYDLGKEIGAITQSCDSCHEQYR